MPVYRLKEGSVVFSLGWMKNPDPSIYTSWAEFAKQLFWDFQMGEAFVLATDYYANGLPSRFRVMPPWAIKVEMEGGQRRYYIGSVDVTEDILHIRYKSSVDNPHGIGPLEAAGARLTTAGILQRQIDEVARNGGVPPYILEVARRLNKGEADELLEQWLESRARAVGAPAIVSGGTTAKVMQQPSPKDMALLELSQFTESRIAVKLGVPPFLMGLPSGGDSMTYSNVSSLFDFHDRASLKVKATHVMQALSWWALPPGESAELNRDEYTRPSLLERANAYKILNEVNALSPEEIRAMERLHGDVAASALTGGNQQ
jgi:HK97 family phage portal protein